MHQATHEEDYLNYALVMHEQAQFYTPRYFDHKDKRTVISILLAKITGSYTHVKEIKRFMKWLMETAPKTPGGLLWLDSRGSNYLAAGVSFIAFESAMVVEKLDFDGEVLADKYRKFGKSQLGYLLGDSGKSFVVGFGEDPPTRPYHRASSCPSTAKFVVF